MMIRVRAPATSANLGAGFDVFALALKEPFDEIIVEESDEIELKVSGISEGVPKDRRNVAWRIAEELGVTARIEIFKGIRAASGLGSSAATSAGVTVALNELYSLGLSKEEMIDISARGEEMISGSYHADNVSAAILGYFTVVKGRGGNLRAVSIPLKLRVAVCLPEIKVSTLEARRSLPEFISLEEHKEDLSTASMMVYEALRGNARRFSELMNRGIAERMRKKFIPFYDDVKRAALEAGAYGVTISGSGPAIIAVISEESSGVERAMKEVFERNGISCECFITESGEGVRILEE